MSAVVATQPRGSRAGGDAQKALSLDALTSTPQVRLLRRPQRGGLALVYAPPSPSSHVRWNQGTFSPAALFCSPLLLLSFVRQLLLLGSGTPLCLCPTCGLPSTPRFFYGWVVPFVALDPPPAAGPGPGAPQRAPARLLTGCLVPPTDSIGLFLFFPGCLRPLLRLLPVPNVWASPCVQLWLCAWLELPDVVAASCYPAGAPTAAGPPAVPLRGRALWLLALARSNWFLGGSIDL